MESATSTYSYEVELFVGAGDDVGVVLALDLSHDGGTYHAPVSGYIDLTFLQYS